MLKKTKMKPSKKNDLPEKSASQADFEQLLQRVNSLEQLVIQILDAIELTYKVHSVKTDEKASNL